LDTKKIEDVVKAEWYPRMGQCITLIDKNKKEHRICYSDGISDAVLRSTAEITEFHRHPGGQELSFVFDKPTTCEIKDWILRCPSTEKMSWEKQEKP